MIMNCHARTVIKILGVLAFVAVGLLAGWPLAALADDHEHHHHVDWGSLNLSRGQQKNINQYESQWEQTYQKISPQIDKDKSDLTHELDSPNPDQSHVMQLQARIEQNKAQLQSASMNAYIHKKQELNDEQRARLHHMMFEGDK